MWKLKTIEAENLCAFRSLSYMLPRIFLYIPNI